MKKSSVKKGVMGGLLAVATVAIVGGTYSRYISTATVNTTVDIAKWSIKLNDTDISTSSTTKQVQLTYDENEFVKSSTIAPGTKGTFDIVLDPTDSEVAVDYLLTIDTENISGITNSSSNIAITGAKYTIEGQAQAVANVVDNTITINEGLADVLAGNTVTVSVTLEWQENSTNAADTANGVAGGTVTIPVTVSATQHI